MAENRFKKYVQPDAGGVIITDPYAADEQARKAEAARLEAERVAIARQQAAISQQNANTSAANAAVTAQNANKPPEGYMYGPAGLTFIPGGPADPAVIEARKAAEAQAAKAAKTPAIDPDRPASILTALENLRQLREMAGKPLATGSFAEQVSGLPVVGGTLGQNRANLKARLAMVQGDLIQQQIARLAAMNGGNGVASIANSETEAARMAASIANLDPNQSEENLLIGIQRAEEYYRRQLDQMKATSGVPEPAPLKAAGAGATTQSLPIPAEMQAEHMAYLKANWGRLDPQGYAQFRTDLDAKYGFGSNTAEYAASADPLNQRAAQGGTPDNAFIPPVVAPLTESEQANNDMMNSVAGRTAAAFANSVGLGIPQALTGDKMELLREDSSGEMFIGDVAGGFLGAGGVGKLLGAAGGASRLAPMLANPLTGDTVYSGIYGAATSDDPVTGALMGVGMSLGGNVVGRQIAQRAPIVTGLRRPEDALGRGERAVYTAAGADIDPVITSLTQARDLGVPMTLADASPELGSLAGSAVRNSPATAGTARTVMATRNDGQIDRLAGAIERDLGPVTNIPQRSEDLMAQAKAAAGPLYDEAYAAPGVEDLDIADLLVRPSMGKAMANAERIAREEGRDPSALGFVLNDAGEVGLGGGGQPLPVFRGEGGNSGGGNYYSTDREFARNFTRSGVDDEISEASILPADIYEAPTLPRAVSEAEMDAAIAEAEAAGKKAIFVDEGTGEPRSVFVINGNIADLAPPQGTPIPTWQTIDYMKRGLDDVVEGYRDPVTGKLNLDTEGRAVNDTLRSFLGRVDEANPAYAQARAAYAGPAQERGFLQRGQQAITTRPDELGVQMNGLTPEQTGQMRLGYQSELMGRANNLRSNTNPWAQLNTPNTEGRLGVLYGGAEDADVARLLTQRDLELQLAGSANRLIGNSATAERAAADAAFGGGNGVQMGDVVQGAVETALLGAPYMTVGRSLAGRGLRARGNARQVAQDTALADELGPLLFNDAPPQAIDAITDIAQRGQQYDAVLAALIEEARRRGGRAGSITGAIVNGRIQD